MCEDVVDLLLPPSAHFHWGPRTQLQIFPIEAQPELFNAVVAICLSVSGNICRKRHTFNAWVFYGKTFKRYVLQGLFYFSHCLSLLASVGWSRWRTDGLPRSRTRGNFTGKKLETGKELCGVDGNGPLRQHSSSMDIFLCPHVDKRAAGETSNSFSSFLLAAPFWLSVCQNSLFRIMDSIQRSNIYPNKTLIKFPELFARKNLYACHCDSLPGAASERKQKVQVGGRNRKDLHHSYF